MFATKYLFWTLLIVTCGYALWRGRKYEKIAASVFIAASLLSVIARAGPDGTYIGIERGDLVIDVAVLAATVAIALVSDRFWPLWVAGLQLTITMSHMMKALSPDLMPLAYAAAERFWAYPTLLILFVAVWRQHRRSRGREGSVLPA